MTADRDRPYLQYTPRALPWEGRLGSALCSSVKTQLPRSGRTGPNRKRRENVYRNAANCTTGRQPVHLGAAGWFVEQAARVTTRVSFRVTYWLRKNYRHLVKCVAIPGAWDRQSSAQNARGKTQLGRTNPQTHVYGYLKLKLHHSSEGNCARHSPHVPTC